MNRVPGVKITPLVWTDQLPSLAVNLFDVYTCRYFGKIQDKDEEYYSQFQIVICGLDSIEARRWINAMLVNLVDDESPESLIPMIDGGTEGKA